MRKILMFVLLTVLLCGSCTAVDAAQLQYDALGGSEIIDALPDTVRDEITGEKDLSDGFWRTVLRIIKNTLGENKNLLRESLHACAMLMLIALFCAAAGMFLEGPGQRAVVLVGVIALCLRCASDARGMVSVGVEAIEELHAFSQLLLPVIASSAAASGSMVASAAIYSGASLFLQILISFVKTVLVPLVYAYLALAAADCAFGADTFGRIRKFIGATVKNSLRAVLYLFGAFLSLTGIISGSADALALKVTKMTVSSAVPVVGGMVSDAAETVLVSAKLVLNSIGAAGMLAVLSIILLPFLRIWLRYLLLQLTAALCSVFGLKEHTKLLDAISSAMGYLLAMTSTCAVMTFISCICFMKVSVL